MRHITFLVALVALLYSVSCSKPQEPNTKDQVTKKSTNSKTEPSLQNVELTLVFTNSKKKVKCKQKTKDMFACTLLKTDHPDHVIISYDIKNDNGTARLFHNSIELVSGESHIEVSNDVIFKLLWHNTADRQQWQRDYLLKTIFKDKIKKKKDN